MKTQTKPGTSNNQPVHKIRHGAISASIWRQETEKGPLFNVSFQRSYKDGEEWKSSTSFGAHNLLVVSLIATRAFEWISEQRVASASVRDGISAAAVVFAPDYGSEDDHQIRPHLFSRDCAGSTSPDSLAPAA